jgi:hypothetical protein
MLVKNLYRAAVVAGAVISLQAGMVEDFEGESATYNYRIDAKNQVFELIEAPQVEGKAGKISWDEAKTKYAEITFKKRVQLPVFESATITIKVFAPADSPVNRFNLRLIDAQGEVFQWNKDVSFKSGGWQEVSFPITTTNFRHNWGGKSNKVLDQPVKAFGFGIDYKKGSGKSHLVVDDLSFSSDK